MYPALSLHNSHQAQYNAVTAATIPVLSDAKVTPSKKWAGQEEAPYKAIRSVLESLAKAVASDMRAPPAASAARSVLESALAVVQKVS